MSRFLPVANPQNRFASSTVTYDDGEAPGAETTLIEDHAKSILATNDSPDVGFRWSVNPYRGCFHACSYCMSGDTAVLMADGRTKPLHDIAVGDVIYGTRRSGTYRHYTRTTVLAHWKTFKRAHRVVLANGTELIASGDHRFLTERGWKHVTGAEWGSLRRPHLTTSNSLLGTGDFGATPAITEAYRRGYLSGMIRGDGMIFERNYVRARGTGGGDQHHSRLALVDIDGVRRTRAYLEHVNVTLNETRLFQCATATTKPVFAFGTSRRGSVPAIRQLVEWPNDPCREWARGFLAGIFDAEGSYSGGVLRISNADPRIVEQTMAALWRFDFDAVLEPAAPNGVRNVRLCGGLRAHLRFFQLVDPAIRRKLELEGVAIKSKEDLRIVSIVDLGFSMRMFDITTGTGDFIANGVVSHNCYARPSHEYLSFGAGSDFARKIVFKPEAPRLLREAFERKAWQGELVVFSGVTDCYQPAEAKLRLTRQCLEVCAEYRNPVGIITKSPLVERDIDLLQDLAKNASVRVSVSTPFWDPDVARAMEPMVTTPARRMKIVETLAKAGIKTGVSVSPIVPGLNDDHLGDVLERAHDAGASYAFYVLLRLPGVVKEIFETALREKLPLRAEKVLRRLREAHGGKLYESAFGARGRGEGVYAETIRMLFERTARRHGLLHDEMPALERVATFRRPAKKGSQTSFGF